MAALIAGLGWRFGALSGSGTVAAALVGTAVLVATGWWGGGVLLLFFATSSAVSRLLPPQAGEDDAKGDRRDHWQVLANGGPAAMGALAGLSEPRLGLWLLTVGLAAAAADTWGTALGLWSGRTPRDLVSGRRVPPGTSGGVTWPGTIGAAAGAATVAVTGFWTLGSAGWVALAIAVGVSGMLVDALLGGTAQGRFECLACRVPTERRLHRCGARTEHRKGWAWCTNDLVNFLATGTAVLAAWVMWAG